VRVVGRLPDTFDKEAASVVAATIFSQRGQGLITILRPIGCFHWATEPAPHVPEWEHEPPSKLFLITGIDVLESSTASEELMRLLALTVATASVLAFAFPQTPRVLAQGSDSGAVGRPLQLDGGSSLGSDNRGQSFGGRSEGTEPSAGVRSEKSQTDIAKTGETTVRGRSRSRIGLSSRPRHRFVIHRRGRRFVEFNEPKRHVLISRMQPSMATREDI
jgi:hypothetical protein